MNLQLTGKKAVVTGSTAGIGLATARLLAAEGARVVLNGRTPGRIEEARKRLAADGLPGPVEGVAADLGEAEGARRILAAHPDVDILVNNVGIYEPGEFERIEDGDWLRFFQVNVMSGVRLSRGYLPGMKARGWGRILFVSSESGVHIPPEMIHYGMTKAAQLAVSRGIAETTAGTGVTVNSVLPGPTASEGVTAFVEKMARERGIDFEEMEEKFFEEARPTSLLRRFIEPEEVARILVYLSSPLSSATNGAALRVDGGVVRAMV